jgi:N-acetylglucosamine kinase-like BadF-type ATPase
LASFAKAIQEFAATGNETAQRQIKLGAKSLVEKVAAIAGRLKFTTGFSVAGIGGMFRGELMKQYFRENLQKEIHLAEFIQPRFNPAVGALLLAYRQDNVLISEKILKNLR